MAGLRRDGVSIIQGELSLLLSSMRRGNRWSGHVRTEEEQDPLISGLYKLQDTLNHTHTLSLLDVNVFLRPFCDVVQSDDTTGPVTGMAIASLDKFLAYGLINPSHPSAPMGIENLSEAVTHARFVGTNPASDEVVLMKILQVLHTLMLTPVGRLLTNESVCEIMQSCFRICFEMRLSQLLRCFAEGTLVDMVQLLFTQLLTFTEDAHLVDDASSMDQTLIHEGTTENEQLETVAEEDEEEEEEVSNDQLDTATTETDEMNQSDEKVDSDDREEQLEPTEEDEEGKQDFVSSDVCYVSSRHKHGSSPQPYGLPCVRELLRFLISITNTRDRHNSESLICIGLQLVTVALECGASHICELPSLCLLVQDGLCNNLLTLLRNDNFTLFSRALRACFLLFESCRQQLKLQLEMFITCLLHLVSVENGSRVSYDRRELALECIVQLCNLPFFIAELYVNFDCSLYCSNIFEHLTKNLSKNAFPTQGVLSTHLLSLEALLTITDALDTGGHLQGIRAGTSTKPEKRLSENPEAFIVDHGHTLSSSSTQLNSAGLIFTSSAGRKADDDESNQDVMSSDEIPSNVQTVSSVQTSLELPLSLHASSSAEALVARDTIGSEVMPYEGGAKSEGSDVTKSASGYYTAIETGRGEALVMEGEGVSLPTSKELIEVRQRKKLILAATEQFNKKPSQGIAFLQEQSVLRTPLDPGEVAQLLLDNPGLDKAMIGEYIGDRRRQDILEGFVKKFCLSGVNLVDSLRHFLESFRLPGESPIIARILETFAEHWLACNHDNSVGRMFSNRDSVYILTYSIMMLNTDQHSSQVRKRMSLEEFVRNQRGTNNKKDFSKEFLAEIYHRIGTDEIIMPSEHVGEVRENYKWKVLLYRSTTPEGQFLPVLTPEFNQDLFLLTWGPAVAALSYVFDTAEEKRVVQKAIEGFSKCASVAAHYELREVFDNLIISVCKFTTLLSMPESPSTVIHTLGANAKARQSLHTMFSLAHHHGDILREGWKNILDCLLTLFKAKLLPDSLVEVEDFLHPDGKVSLYREEAPARTDSSLLSSLYSYWLLSNDSQGGGGGASGGKNLSPSEIKVRKVALKCVKECHPEQLFSESKFLRNDCLPELVKALTFASRGPDAHVSLGTTFDEDTAVFFMELLISVAMENKDRISLFWSDLSNHISRTILTAHKYRYLLERAVVGLLRLAIRLMSRGTLTPQLLNSLHVLPSLPPPTSPPLRDIHKQLANGISELVRSHASTIKSPHDWSTLFVIIEYAGTGLSHFAAPGHVSMETKGAVTVGKQEVGVATAVGIDGDVAGEYTCSASETDQSNSGEVAMATGSDWVWVSEAERIQKPVMSSLNQFDLLVEEALPMHDPQSFFKMCESLSYLVRSERHITPANFGSCLRCIRIFSEVSASSAALDHDRGHASGGSGKGGGRHGKLSPTRFTPSVPAHVESGGKGKSATYTSTSLQLLDLMDTLYSRVGRIFNEKVVARLQSEMVVAGNEVGSVNGGQSRSSNLSSESAMQEDSHATEAAVEGITTVNQVSTNSRSPIPPAPPIPDYSESSATFPQPIIFPTESTVLGTPCGLMWHIAWCPLLQGMGRMCCDPRRSVRQAAITYLQRALLAPDLQNLIGYEWEACFLEVFFPMLSRLLEDIPTSDWVNLEETRVRSSNLLCKVFLQHLPSLSQLHNFPELWMGVLDFMDKFLHLENSDLLYEAIPESLKNMLLVMSTQGVFDVAINSSQPDSAITLNKAVSAQQLWQVTWHRIDEFLPNFLRELFPSLTPPPPPPSSEPLNPPPPQPSQGPHVLRENVPPYTIPMASPVQAIPTPTQSPQMSPQSSPPRGSPVPEAQRAVQVAIVPFPITLHPPLPSVTLPPHTLTPPPPTATGNHAALTEGRRSSTGQPNAASSSSFGAPDTDEHSQTTLETVQTSVEMEPSAESAAPPYSEKPQYSSVYSV